MPFITRREWGVHQRELERERKRAERAEYRYDELVNRMLTKQGSFGIAREPPDVTAQSSVPVKPKTVGGLTEEEFIEDLVDSGLSEGEARAKWKHAQEIGILPYQLEGELPS